MIGTNTISATGRRRGAVTLELLLFLPVFVIFLLAVIEFAIIFQVDKLAAEASRYGAKLASEVSDNPAVTPNLSTLNQPSADDLKDRIDQYLSDTGLTASCQVILEHNHPALPNSRQDNPPGALPDCPCGPTPVSTLPASPPTLVRVTVCVPLEGNVPNVLASFGFDISGRTIQRTTVFRFENL